MKRIFIDLLLIIIVSAFFIQRAYAQANLTGDINGDGTVTLTDLSTLLSNFGKQNSGTKSPVQITVLQHVGSSDTTVYQAKVVVRDSATDQILGQGLTDANGKSPQWQIAANTAIDVYAYPPTSYLTEYCGSVWSVNTGPYGTAQNQNLRLNIKSGYTGLCVQDKMCTWTP